MQNEIGTGHKLIKLDTDQQIFLAINYLIN